MLIPQIPSFFSFLRKGVYNPRAVFLHAALLRQAFAHCGKFLTAALRRGLDRVSVPVWLIILLDQLLIVALVSYYLTNKLIRRKPVLRHEIKYFIAPILSSFSSHFQELFSSER